MLAALATLFLTGTVAAAPPDFQPLDDIKRAAIEATVHDGSDASVNLDANLRMPTCAEPLRAQSGARSTAEVSCAGPTAWKLYVPVRIMRNLEVVVLTQSVGAGQPITAAAISVERRDASAVVGSVVHGADQAVGRVAARTLVAGSALVENDLVAPRVIRRGEAVTLVVHSDGVQASAPGKALGDAGINERINVENANSHRVVQGTVRGSGEVEVAP